MRPERSATDGETGRLDTQYGESERATERLRDERELYGEPRHEAETEYDEQSLYGEPQHETGDDAEESDPDLLSAPFRNGAVSGPTVTGPREVTGVGTAER